MGKQSARLWYNGKDHKDLWKLIDNEESFLGKSWRMHWQIYKGNKLLWGKLPPKFLAFCKAEYSDSGYYYGSDDGKIFTYYGFVMDYHNKKAGITLSEFCKVREFIFAAAIGIICTTNCYSWKTLDDVLNIPEAEFVRHLRNYNDRLLVITDNKIILYDIENDEIKHLSDGQFDFINSEVYSFGDTLLVICYKRINMPYGYFHQQYLLVFKNDVLVKTFSDVLGENGYPIKHLDAESLTGNRDTAYMIASQSVMSGMELGGSRYSIFSSKDGLTWKDEYTTYTYNVDGVFCTKEGVYAFYDGRDINGTNYPIFKLVNGSLIRIGNKFDIVPHALGVTNYLAFETKDYMYANASVLVDEEKKLCFIRFKDFESEEYEILTDQAFYAGIYIEN